MQSIARTATQRTSGDAGKGVCLVVGDAPGALRDLSEFLILGVAPAAICCINRAGLWFPFDFRFWVSWHAEMLPVWAGMRSGPELWSTQEYPGVQLAKVRHGYGSSAMLGVQFALATWGFSKVVIIGVHMTGAYATYRDGCVAVQKDLGDRIRAIGGFSEELFGRLDASWVAT